tara:strand:- start:168 stop:575 length:408 start_codon:yes stop_codon:yes gene_type:complete
MKKIFSFITVLILASCASIPNEDDISKADYGLAVSFSDCESQATEFISNRMKDPSSAKFVDFECYRGYEGSVPLAGVSITYGYRFYGQVNAKNSFGGYTGYTPFAGIVRDDGNGPVVVRYCITDNSRICFPYSIQ